MAQITDILKAPVAVYQLADVDAHIDECIAAIFISYGIFISDLQDWDGALEHLWKELMKDHAPFLNNAGYPLEGSYAWKVITQVLSENVTGFKTRSELTRIGRKGIIVRKETLIFEALKIIKQETGLAYYSQDGSPLAEFLNSNAMPQSFSPDVKSVVEILRREHWSIDSIKKVKRHAKKNPIEASYGLCEAAGFLKSRIQTSLEEIYTSQNRKARIIAKVSCNVEPRKCFAVNVVNNCPSVVPFAEGGQLPLIKESALANAILNYKLAQSC